MNKYEKDENVLGVITGINRYGLFLRIDDEYTGMIHISEISNKYVKDIRKLYVIGEKVESKIISVDEEKKQLKLSLKGHINNRMNAKILKEDGRGFEPLKENLDFWVEKKLEDIRKKKKNE